MAEPWLDSWSSCRAYALGETNRLLQVNPWYEELGSRASSRQKLWREFLMGKDPKEEVIGRPDWAIGGSDFCSEWLQVHSRAVPRRSGRPGRSMN